MFRAEALRRCAPVQAVLTSTAAFAVGTVMPLPMVLLSPAIPLVPFVSLTY